MVRRIDAKFRPHYKYEDFAPNEPLWHLGDLGYLPADVWRNTFDHEPRWMEPAYILQGNMGDEGCEEIAETYTRRGLKACGACSKHPAWNTCTTRKPTRTVMPDDTAQKARRLAPLHRRPVRYDRRPE